MPASSGDNTQVPKFVIRGLGGNVGIGITAPAYKLHVSGAIFATGDITAFSDRRLKTDVETIDGALQKVQDMRGVYYTSQVTNERGVGVIAQELQEVCPELVKDKGEFLGVAYGNITGILIEAIKELSKNKTFKGTTQLNDGYAEIGLDTDKYTDFQFFLQTINSTNTVKGRIVNNKLILECEWGSNDIVHWMVTATRK